MKRYECTQDYVRKIVGTSLWNMPSRLRRSQKNPQTTDEERCQGATELDSLEKEIKGVENNNGTK